MVFSGTIIVAFDFTDWLFDTEGCYDYHIMAKQLVMQGQCSIKSLTVEPALSYVH